MSYNIEVEGGKTVKLPTAGKYCDRDILVTAKGGAGDYTEEDVQNARNEGITEGIQTEYDRFWDAYQQNGNLRDYRGFFSGIGWTAETIKPKYNLIVTNGQGMFQWSPFAGDLVQHLENLGVALDISDNTRFTSMFSDMYYVTRIGVIDTRKAIPATVASVFAYCWALVTIDKFIITETSSLATCFVQCHALENLTIEGTIGTTGLNLQWSTKLSKASITSVVNALSSTTSGLSVTLSKTAVNAAFTTAEWTALAATKSNWTLNLV